MSQIADASYIGKGEIFIQPYAGNAAMRSVGNCSALTISHETEKKELLDYTSAGGGKANTLERITGVTLSITAHDIIAKNLALGAFGSVSAVLTGTVTDEPHVAYQGGLTVLNNLPDLTQTITVEVGATAMVEGTDYIVNNAGIYVLTGGAIDDGDTILVTYTRKPSDVVQAMVNTGQNYKLVFVGLNEAQSGKQVLLTVHKFKPGAAQNVAYLGDDYAALELPGEALSDSAITGAGLSKFYTVKTAV